MDLLKSGLSDVADLLIINESNSELLRLLPNNCKVLKFERKKGSRFDFRSIIKYNKVLVRYNKIFLHSPSLLSIGILHIKRTTIILHGFTQYIPRFARHCEWIAVSHSIEAFCIQNNFKVKEVIENGLRVDRIPEHESSRNFMKIACIGRIDFNTKGQDRLMKALELVNKNLAARLTVEFIGDGPDRPALDQMIAVSNFKGKINLTGSLKREVLFNISEEIDLFVQPSRSEAFGLSALEVLCMGKDLIVSRCSGLLEVTSGGSLCYGVFENEHDLAELINDYYSSHTESNSNSRALITERYNIDLSVRKYIRLCLELQ